MTAPDMGHQAEGINPPTSVVLITAKELRTASLTSSGAETRRYAGKRDDNQPMPGESAAQALSDVIPLCIDV